MIFDGVFSTFNLVEKKHVDMKRDATRPGTVQSAAKGIIQPSDIDLINKVICPRSKDLTMIVTAEHIWIV